MNIGLTLLMAGSLLLAMQLPAVAKVSAEQAAKLGTELSPIGANPKANAAGTIPAWKGESIFSDRVKQLGPDDLEKLRQEIVAYGEAHPNLNLLTNMEDIKKAAKDSQAFQDIVGQLASDLGGKTVNELQGALDPKFVITRGNYKKYADHLSAGHRKLFELYDDYRMIVYPSVRGAYYPDKINAATEANATRATLQGTDGVSGAKLGFPFPIPTNGAQVIWNHKLKFRGSAVRRYNDQAVVDADGSFEITKTIESAQFEYSNLSLSPDNRDEDVIAYFLQQTVAPPRVAGQFTLVHEIFGLGTSGRNAWIYNPGLGRVNRAPDVGFDNPSIGSDGLQFNDQFDMFNGSLSRYNWKLVGKKEIYIPYNSYLMNNPLAKYSDIVKKGHINQGMARYELHRVWVVEATLREGLRHQIARRTFYVDEDSWSIALVDCYDNRGNLWRFQEGHLLTAPFVPTTTTSPEVIYDLQSGRYFVTAMSNQGTFPDFEIKFEEGFFSPGALKRRARLR
ncbi:MAG: DUF1329 domain-containing protein [Salinisphaera sp.]|nr:DUF1329 domain-containing protein [Salinisphaera sp.]